MLNDFNNIFELLLMIDLSYLKFGYMSLKSSSIDCESCLMEQRSQIRIPLLLPLHDISQKKNKKTFAWTFKKKSLGIR